MLISFSCFINGELESLRLQYLEAALNKDKLVVLENSCKTTPDDPVATGYCTMIHFLEAKNAFNPYRKLSEFEAGKKKLNALIASNSKSIELRYLRHSIQERVPRFLGYHDQLGEDENFMLTNLKSVSDSSTYKLIYNYLHHRNE